MALTGRSRCGIHGEPTSTERCESCDDAGDGDVPSRLGGSVVRERHLFDADTDEDLGPATAEHCDAFDAANDTAYGKTGQTSIIAVPCDGRRFYVDDGSESLPRYPDVTVELISRDGNAYFVLGQVSQALTAAGVEKPEVDLFYAEATSGDYDHLLQTCFRWVDVA